MSAIGLHELIAESLSAYETRALELARDGEALRAVTTKLRANRSNMPLFDTPRFTRHLEAAFDGMRERQRQGLPPETFAVASARMSEALLMNAVRLHQTGDLVGAERLYGAVLRANPRHAQALYLLGFIHFQRGQYDEAERLIGQSLQFNPQSPDAWYNRGCALQRLQRHGEAVSCFDRAVALKPDYDEAWTNRGAALLALRRHAEAFESFSKALALKPQDFEALSNRGTTSLELKRYEEASADYDALFKLAPDFPYAAGNAALARAYCCDWRFLQAGSRTGPCRFAGWSRDCFPACEHVDRWGSVRSAARGADLGRRTLPGIAHSALEGRALSSRPHPRGVSVGRLSFARDVASWLRDCSTPTTRARFETVAISFGPDDTSGMRERLTRAFDRFIDVRDKSDGAAAALIRDMEIDIAVDLKGFTQDARPGILALRPAPVQVNYLGHPGTMGARYIDYLIADRRIVPDGHERYYSEKIVYLPDSYQANDRKRRIAEQHAGTRGRGTSGDGLRLLLVQRQLQDHAGDVRHLDASAQGRRGKRALAARRQSRSGAKSETRGRGARCFGAATCFCAAHDPSRSISRGTVSPICSSTRCLATRTRRQAMRCGRVCRC